MKIYIDDLATARARIAELESTPLKPYVELKEARERIAALEAERDRLKRVLDVAVADLEEMVAWSTEHGTMRHYAARTLERLSKEFTRS